MKEYTEPAGYHCAPGFVKKNPLNNKIYLQKCIEIFPEWAELLIETNQKIEKIIPEYNIAQIKEKFYHLRYYVDFPENTPKEQVDKVREIINKAEKNAQKLD